MTSVVSTSLRSGSAANQKSVLRLLKILNSAGQTGIVYELNEPHFNFHYQQRKVTFEKLIVIRLQKAALIKIGPAKVTISIEGIAALKRLLHPEEAFMAQHLETISKTVTSGTGSFVAMLDANESVLSRLYCRKDKNGRSWLTESEYEAGEKLRSDFEKGQLQPRISANWEASVATSSRGNNAVEISDFAMDARHRVGQAIENLDRDIAGVLLDVCCFLKGLEQVERERKWPPRSAKLMLRSGLRCLADHYGLRSGKGTRSMASWAVEGYRPQI